MFISSLIRQLENFAGVMNFLIFPMFSMSSALYPLWRVREGSVLLASLARTKLILATADLDTAEQCARYIGNREVRQMDEAYSYGYNNTRDASTLTPRKQVE